VQIEFSGPVFNQVRAFSTIDVDDDEDADTYEAIPGSGYFRPLDSFFFTSIFGTAAPPFNGVQNGAPGNSSFRFSAGTPVPGGAIEMGPLAQLVVPEGSTIMYSGVIGRQGMDFDVSGSYATSAVPEPGLAALVLALPTALLAHRRVRRTQR
jgi:hypothetical protein